MRSGRRPSPADGATARAVGRQRSYHAFISYNRAADGKLAPALQRGLQRFAKPWYRLRALRIFRDDASLGANPNLWGSIEQALDGSEFFILLASPESAASKWVAKEAQYWLEHRGTDRLLVALTDGELVWSPNGGVDDGRSNAVPPSLHGAFADEPRYVDLRWARSEGQLSQRDARFRSALADLAAPLHGRSKDDMLGEDVRQHRRTITIAWASGVLLAVLAVGASIAALLAVQARDRAQTEARTALSRQLAAQSVGGLDGPTAISPLLGLEAFRLVREAPAARGFDARDAMLRSLERSPRLVATLPASGVGAVAFAPDGKTLASGGARGSVRFWRARDGTALGRERIDHRSDVTSIAFTPDGATLATGCKDGRVRFWDARTRKPLGRPLAGHEVVGGIDGSVNSLAFSPNGDTLVSGGFDGEVVLWDVNRRRVLRVLGTHDSEVESVAFRDGQTVVSTDGLATTKLWDAGRGAALRRPPLRTVGRGEGFGFVGFSEDGRLLASAFDGLALWDTLGRRPLGRPLSGEFTSRVGFSKDERTIAAAYVGRIDLWDTRRRKRIDVLPLNTQEDVQSLRFGARGTMLASLAADGTVRLWDARRTKPLGRVLRPRAPLSLVSGGVTAVAAAPDGQTIVSAADETVTFWHLRAGRSIPLARRAATPVANIAFAPGGRTVATGGRDGTVTLWDARRATAVGSFRTGVRDGLASMAFADGGKQLVTGSAGGAFEFWDVAARKRLDRARLAVPGPCADSGGAGDPTGKYATCREIVAVSPDRTTAAVFGGSAVKLWDVAGRKSRGTLRAAKYAVTAVAFGPDHRTFVTGGAGTLRLWDLVRQQPLGQPLELSGGDLRSVAFSPDGSVLASGASDGTVTAWDPILLSSDYDAWRTRLCRIAGRNLTPDEWNEFLPGERYHATCPELTTRSAD